MGLPSPQGLLRQSSLAGLVCSIKMGLPWPQPEVPQQSLKKVLRKELLYYKKEARASGGGAAGQEASGVQQGACLCCVWPQQQRRIGCLTWTDARTLGA